MITDIEAARQKILSTAKPSLVAEETKSDGQPLPNQSFYGGAFYGRKGESWPMFEDRPLVPWLYLVPSALPWIPDHLKSLAAVAFYIDHDFSEGDCFAEEGSQLVVREYLHGEELTLLEYPVFEEDQPYLLHWEAVDDFPCPEYFETTFSEEVYDYFCDNDEAQGLANRSGIKIGGWPTLIQLGYEGVNPDEFTLQIEATENYMYADTGIAYVSRRADGRWYFLFDCC